MIILDTCALIYDALTPEKLTSLAKKSIIQAEKRNQLFCCGISLWEIAMLIQKKRLNPGTDTQTFLQIMLQARIIQVLNITVEIAALSTTDSMCQHFDPADRIIAATALYHNAKLITADKKLQEISDLNVIW